MPIVMLVDNGSVSPAATLQLRKLANSLSERVAHDIVPVSLNHADRVSSDKLDGRPAKIFSQFMRYHLLNGEQEFIFLPLFFSKGKALTAYVPDVLKSLKDEFGEFSFTLANVLYPLPHGEKALVSIVYQRLMTAVNDKQLPLKNIVLVDHGSPSSKVTAVRQHIAQAVQDQLPDRVLLEQAVMERRKGKEYDFNGELLEDWLKQKAKSGEAYATVVLMFILPGRHAGVGGDISEICNRVMADYPDFKIAISPLIGDHPRLLEILESRLKGT